MKKLLIDILHAWEEKLINDECTPEEIRHYSKMVSDNIDVLVTTKELSDMYHKPVPSVKMVIHRSKLAETNPPKVRKFYSLSAFRKIMPSSWHKDK